MQAAREADVSVEWMLYRGRQFAATGLLEDVGTQARAGRSLQLYRAPAGFRVLFHLTPWKPRSRGTGDPSTACGAEPF